MVQIGQDTTVVVDDGKSERGVAYLFHVFDPLPVSFVGTVCGEGVVG